jgi:hypothetical protein
MHAKLQSLLSALMHEGTFARAYTEDRVSITENDTQAGIEVSFPVAFGSVSILIGKYWAVGGAPAYFVNWHGNSENFIAHSGTPFLEVALINYGACLHAARSVSTKGN